MNEKTHSGVVIGFQKPSYDLLLCSNCIRHLWEWLILPIAMGTVRVGKALSDDEYAPPVSIPRQDQPRTRRRSCFWSGLGSGRPRADSAPAANLSNEELSAKSSRKINLSKVGAHDFFLEIFIDISY